MRACDPDDGARAKRFSRRSLLIGLAQAGAFAAIGTRLYQLQVIDGAHYAPLAEDNRISLHVLAPRRGRILDRYGEVLAGNEEGFRATLLPGLAGDVPAVLSLVAQIFPMSVEEQERLAVRAARSRPNMPLQIRNDLTFEQVAKLNLHAPRLPGVVTETSFKRRYFHGAAVGHIVGYTGSVEQLAMGDDPALRLPHMRIGRSGIERGMDADLRGKAGTERLEVDAKGRIVRNLGQVDSRPGDDIVVTIDAKLQARVLARASAERRAAVAALDVTSGEVVAMVSVPTYDPNDLANGVTRASWRNMLSAPHKPLVNRCISGTYPPGSTFKMVTALAALEAGVIGLKDRISCTGTYELADQSYRCWNRSGHGRCDLHRAMRESCDTYFYEIAQRTGITAIAAMARKLGLGQTYACGLALQKRGIIPGPDWKIGRFGLRWTTGETVLTGIGQGYVLTTPLQLAVMAARLANGRAVAPTLVRRPRSAAQMPFLPLDIRPKWLDAVRSGMVAVVNEPGGTGHNAQLSSGRSKVAGKTGTSQIVRASETKPQEEIAWERRDHALFVGYLPAERPRYAVAAVVEHGGSGGATAAPLVRDVMEMLLDADPAGKPSPATFGPTREAHTGGAGHPT